MITQRKWLTLVLIKTVVKLPIVLTQHQLRNVVSVMKRQILTMVLEKHYDVLSVIICIIALCYVCPVVTG